MADFPLFIWRDMLPDLREWMIQHALNETNSVDETVSFWKAFSSDKLMGSDGNKAGVASE